MSGFTTLISAGELAAHLEYEHWRVFDCRHDLANVEAGHAAYRAGHIPGAQFLHLDRDLSGPMTGRNGRHPLPEPQRLAQRLGECGVDNATQVIAYDDAGGIFAARLWWLLRWLGQRQVAVLDGGLTAWRDAGLPLTEAIPRVEPRRLRIEPGAAAVDAGFVLAHRGDPETLLVDARSPDRFRGENETVDPVAGHIPGSVNRFFRRNLDDRARFKEPDELRGEWQELLAGRAPHCAVHTCGSGVTACHNLLAMELAGLTGSRLYAGSWSEWCADPDRPVATGSA